VYDNLHKTDTMQNIQSWLIVGFEHEISGVIVKHANRLTSEAVERITIVLNIHIFQIKHMFELYLCLNWTYVCNEQTFAVHLNFKKIHDTRN